MKTLFLNFIILLIYNETAHAQIIKGRVFRFKTKEPIAFANIGIVGKGIGTVTMWMELLN